MAQKQFLDKTGLGQLVVNIKAEDAKVLQSAKDYADGLADNYEAAGAVATAKEELEAKIKENADAITAINNEETGILKQAKDYADGKDGAIAEAKKAGDDAQADVDALEQYVGTIPETSEATNVIAYVQEKTAGIATDTALEELTGRVATAEGAIDAIEADYLKKADKDELAGDIKANTDAIAVLNGDEATEGSVAKEVKDAINAFATEISENGTIDTFKELVDYVGEHGGEAAEMASAIDALELLVGDKSVATQIAEAITAENLGQYATDEELADAIARIVVVEGKAHEHTNKTLLDTYTQTEADLADAVAKKHTHTNADVLNGITADKVTAWDNAEQNAKDYVDEKVEGVDLSGIATNAADIDKLEESLAEGGATANAIADAKKAGTDAQGTANANAEAIEALQGLVGETSVETQISAAITSANLDQYATDDELATERGRIDALEAKVGEGFIAITNEEIDALFTSEE